MSVAWARLSRWRLTAAYIVTSLSCPLPPTSSVTPLLAESGLRGRLRVVSRLNVLGGGQMADNGATSLPVVIPGGMRSHQRLAAINRAVLAWNGAVPERLSLSFKWENLGNEGGDCILGGDMEENKRRVHPTRFGITKSVFVVAKSSLVQRLVHGPGTDGTREWDTDELLR
ncbi:hypothetical protein PTI98_009167 [Pleurotus ostreatus]|nr:hypothetical protein PTI98_009167 [Pleurotus ostreatus]